MAGKSHDSPAIFILGAPLDP